MLKITDEGYIIELLTIQRVSQIYCDPKG